MHASAARPDQSISQGNLGGAIPRCAYTGEMVERPDHAGRAHVKARIAILGTVVLRMRWPEARRVQPSARVGDNLVDRRLGFDGIPSLASEPNMPSSIDHKSGRLVGWPSEAAACHEKKRMGDN